jgi:undecaprenyl diphosphate synthase
VENKIKTVGVIGSGTMGIGIVQVAASNGCQVCLFDVNEELTQKSLHNLENTLQKLAQKEKISFQEAEDIFNKGLRLHVIGDIDKLPNLVKDQLFNLMEITKDNTRGNLVLALSYGSKDEILNAVKQISNKVKRGELQPEDINESIFEQHLYTKNIPPVDLLIRTSGEVRVSNFLLWQIAYAEMQFLDILWPDFNREVFFQCIHNFQNTERRYGKTTEQLS